ncbi:hypothetical protein RHGRI_021952 [Rhododendron griersonianum]|uniref:Thaumatin-like protein n=1 Tax=Rhododendron griersonianum TaxID=479676 RepID=A0AAV6JM13_9ERIC|nr:hypothetical protein RHGRI_021952 [Rhododendron griersonianum]KAG5542256.1 hypothetical protein RHGRI_021952 [Rhododendron griersonianum]
MAIKHIVSLLLVSLAIFFQGSRVSARSTVFTVKNLCSYTIWPGTLEGNNGAVLGGGGFSLAPGASNRFPAPAGFGLEQVANSTSRATEHAPPVTVAASSTAAAAAARRPSPLRNSQSAVIVITSWISMTYNAGMGIQPSGGAGDCKYAGCVADLNPKCPPELEVTSAGSIVACKSACAAFNTPEYCCTVDHSTPATCPPTEYSKLFKQACPDAYSYAYDDETSTFTCSGADYTITFCPTGM